MVNRSRLCDKVSLHTIYCTQYIRKAICYVIYSKVSVAHLDPKAIHINGNMGGKQNPYTRICLPHGPRFNDFGHALVAGYGRYRRAPCEVGRQGPEKFEYCGTGEECTRGSSVSK